MSGLARCARALGAGLLVAAASCRERTEPAPTTVAGPTPAPHRRLMPLVPEPPASVRRLEEGLPERDPLARLSPPEHPSQRLAVSGDRLGWLDGEALRVLELPALTEVTHFPAAGARNVVGITGGGFLIAARDHVLRLSPGERRPEAFPHAPRIGPTTLIASRHESAQFWLYYSGISLVPRFDLAAPERIASLPILDWTELFAFDRRALLGLGDGSFVYTTSDGLRRIDVEGRREPLPSAELGANVWALARDARLDRVWAATERHLYLVHVRERAELLRRLELPEHPVAMGSDAGVVAVLSVERWLDGELRLRVDVDAPGAPAPLVFRLDAHAPAPGDAGHEPALEPELVIIRERGWVAVSAFGLHVYDFRRSVRLYPPDDLAQKLAPGAR